MVVSKGFKGTGWFARLRIDDLPSSNAVSLSQNVTQTSVHEMGISEQQLPMLETEILYSTVHKVEVLFE